MSGEDLVRDYLRRLEAEARRLPDDRRAELVSEVREHIEIALTQAGSGDEAVVRTVLEHLGSPATIVDADQPTSEGVTNSSRVMAAPSRGESAWGTQELIALLLVTVGAVILPIVGPLLGLVLIWISGRLATRVKVAVSVMSLVLAVPMMFVLLAGAGGRSERSIPPQSVETSAPTATFDAMATPGTP
jgi:uncharacterized membrane protein